MSSNRQILVQNVEFYCPKQTFWATYLSIKNALSFTGAHFYNSEKHEKHLYGRNWPNIFKGAKQTKIMILRSC